MIDYIDAACKAWGRCTRWILTDTNEGYPSADNFAKARAGMLDAATDRALVQHFGEVRLGDALDIARALAQQPYLREDAHAVLWAQYVVKAKAWQRAKAVSGYLGVDISIPRYWRLLDNAHHFLSARVDVPRGKSLQHEIA